MDPKSHAFKQRARDALVDTQLQRALKRVPGGFIVKRAKARAALPEFDDLRAEARAIKQHTLAHLDAYLEAFEKKVIETGGHIHWVRDAQAACNTIADICEEAGARKVTKGKSMIAEEIALNAHLEAQGLEVIETDLGEYLIQIRNEPPSHIIAPAIHLSRDQIERDFRAKHKDLPKDRHLDDAADLVGEARAVLRQAFLSADVGITGANFLIAETGSTVIVTNEGNGDLTQTLPKVHIVIASIDKVLPTLEDADAVLRVLARSATGQEMSTYTTFSTGPRRDEDPDGPDAFHVVVLDNGRSQMLGGPFEDMLRCIRCGACMNHCPVYGAVGGHAYGWVYPGPMGAVLTPSLIGIDQAGHLPNASSFCGRCQAVCPMGIPLPEMMRRWRERAFETGSVSIAQRLALRTWAYLARRPSLYHAVMRIGMPVMAAMAGGRGAFRRWPMAGGWTAHRDLPAPQGGTFQSQWRKRQIGRR